MRQQRSGGATPKRKSWLTLLPSWSLKALGVVLILAVLLVGGVVLFSRWHWTPLPVQQIAMNSALRYQQPEQLKAVLDDLQGRSLLLMDLNKVRTDLEALPWIRSATLMKRWPAQLMVTLIEHDPVAFWNDNVVLNSAAEALQQPVAKLQLAHLAGPEGYAETVMDNYLQFSQLFQEFGYRVAEVALQKRGSWSLTLTNGVHIRLGDRELLQRSSRVVQTLIAMQESQRSIEQIDARYPNGVAVRFAQTPLKEIGDDLTT